MKKGLMKVGAIMFYTGLFSFIAGLAIMILMLCFNVAKYIITKTFSILF